MIKDINPATGEIIRELQETSFDQLDDYVGIARKKFHEWKRTSRIYRADLFDNLAQEIKKNIELLTSIISLETGKSLNEARAEVVESLHMIQYVAAQGRQPYGSLVASELDTKDIQVTRKPKGVVGVISAWNFPLAIGSCWCAAPAILEGNVVIHKPSELTPLIAIEMEKLYHKAGFPAYAYRVVQGTGVLGDALVRQKIDHILFTGSAEVGKDIRQHCASIDGKTCSLECGSKSATIVFEDGDLNLAVDAAIASAFKLTGQRCVSSSRILVQENIFDGFARPFLERVSKLTWGDPMIDDYDFGPVISQDQKNRVGYYNQMVREDPEAKVLVDYAEGGGLFMGPFVYTTNWRDVPYLKHEVFGPHVALIPFEDEADAIRIYNDTDYGLALGVITDDFRRHRRLAQECVTGMLYINGGSIAAESHVPFSSWKKSGYGASASATWQSVTHPMTITTNFEEGGMTFAQGMK